jgi:RND family efflux transporter MFP subunit
VRKLLLGSKPMVLGILLTGLLAGCGGSSSAKETVALMAEKDTTVTAESIKSQTFPVVLSQPGTTYAIRNVNIDSRVTGYVESVDFMDGQLVKAGDRLFQLDPRPFEAALLEARGNLEAAVASRNLAERTLERNRPLVETGAISREDFDQLVTNLEQSEGQVETAAGSLVNAELNLSFSTISAPFDGQLGQRQVELGALVQPSGFADTLVTIVQYDPMRILVSVDAKNLPQLVELHKKGTVTAKVRVNGTRGGGGKVFDGVIDFIDNQVDPMTSTAMVRVKFENPDAWAYPGQYGEAQILVRNVANAVVIPQRALRAEQGGGSYVWLIDSKNKITRQDITIGETVSGQSWIEKGLRAGQRIVVDSGGELSTGDIVKIVTAAQMKAEITGDTTSTDDSSSSSSSTSTKNSSTSSMK